jgi:hypothetical protein
LYVRNDPLSAGNDPLREHNDPLSPRNDPVRARNDSLCADNEALSPRTDLVRVRNGSLRCLARTGARFLSTYYPAEQTSGVYSALAQIQLIVKKGV